MLNFNFFHKNHLTKIFLFAIIIQDCLRGGVIMKNVQNTDDVSFLLRYLIKTYNESSNKINKIRAVLKFEDIEK